MNPILEETMEKIRNILSGNGSGVVDLIWGPDIIINLETQEAQEIKEEK